MVCTLAISKITWMQQWPACPMGEEPQTPLPCLWSRRSSSHPQSPLWTPNTNALPFPLMWRFTHFTARSLPLTFILGQTLRRRRFVSLKTPCINHIKSPGNKSGGWQHQTNTPISHCALFHVYHIADEGGVVYSGISHTVKAKRTYRLAHSTSAETSGLLCSQLQ